MRVWYPPRHQDFNDLPNAYRIVGFDNGRFRLTCAGLLGSLWSDVQVTVTDDFNNAVVQWPVRVRLALQLPLEAGEADTAVEQAEDWGEPQTKRAFYGS